MKFTDMVPTEPGWYWVKEKDIYACKTIVQVYDILGELSVGMVGQEDGCNDTIKGFSMYYLWGDRIPEPEVEE